MYVLTYLVQLPAILRSPAAPQLQISSSSSDLMREREIIYVYCSNCI